MFDFLFGIFRYSYWTIAFVVLCILGAIVHFCESVGDEWQEDKVESCLKDDCTDEAVQMMHEHFIDAHGADTMHVHTNEGVLVEKVARKCIELDDRESAQLLYDEYRRAMSDHGRKKLEDYLNHE